MYKIYTSYFCNKSIKNLNKDVFRIPICANLQNYTLGIFIRWYKELAPDPEILNQFNNINTKTKSIKEWFANKYYMKLNKLKVSGILDNYVEELRKFNQYNDIVLLCYEKPTEFCHRHLLANYLNKFYNLDIKEF